MTPTNDHRERLAAAFSLLVGIAVASSLVGVSLKTPRERTLKPIRVSQGVRFSAPVTPPVPTAALPPVAVVPIQTPEAPKAKPRKLKPQPPQPAAVSPKPEPVVSEPAPLIETPAYNTVKQPDLRANTTASVADLPMLPGQASSASPDAKPAAPPDDYEPPQQEYLEKPGGEVLVIGVLVDHTGRGLKSQILVPSWNDLKNYTLTIVAKDTTFTELNMQPGQTRWLEIRYVIPQEKPGILP